MNIFNRELKLLLRSKLFIFISPVVSLFIGIWHYVVGDIYTVYSLFPLMLCFIIPLFTYGLWYREKDKGLEGFFLISNFSIHKIISEKILFSFMVSILLLLLSLPLLLLHGSLGFVDIGTIISIFIGLSLNIALYVSIGFFISSCIRGRILIYIITLTILLGITLNSGYGNGDYTSLIKLFSITKLNQDFYKGIISFKSILSILSLSLIILTFSKNIITKSFQIKYITIFIGLFIISLFITGKIDVTKNRDYTLNSRVKEELNSGDVPVRVSYYYSSELKNRSSEIEDIEFILNKIGKINGVSVEIITDVSDLFKKAVNSFNAYPLGSENKLYSFMVIEYLSNFKIVPLVTVKESIEFEILNAYMELKRGSKRHIGIMPGDSELTEDSFSVLNGYLNEYFEVSYIFPGDHIPDDLSTLLVIGHYYLDYDSVSSIGHYLEHGGNVLIAGTGLPTSEGLNYRNTPILDSLDNIGITIEAFLVADNNNVGIVDDKGRITPYPLNVITKADYSKSESLIISPFPGFNALYLSPVLTEDSRFNTLITSSDESWLVTKDTGLEGTPEGAYPVAIYGEGSFSSAFHGDVSSETNRIVVVGNSLSFTDFAYNLGVDAGYDFIIRSIYKLSGDETLLMSRNKMASYKPLYKIDYPYKDKIQMINILFVIIYPLILLAISLIIQRRQSA